MSDASDPIGSQVGPTPPGWYPDPSTNQPRWWDGANWGAFQASASAPMSGSSADPKQSAMWAHYSGAGVLFLTCGSIGWLGPLIIYLTQGQHDRFVKDQAAEALNFQITIAIALVGSAILMLVLIGFILYPVVWVAGVALGAMGGAAANRGEWYRYPFSITFVKV